MKKVTYEIHYHKPSERWVLWQTIESGNSTYISGIYRGTKKECQQKKKELEGRKENTSNGKRTKSVKGKKSDVRK